MSKIELVEWLNEHWYKRAECVLYPSSTTILGVVNQPYLTRWYGDLGWEAAQAKMKYAGYVGTKVHHLIYNALQFPMDAMGRVIPSRFDNLMGEQMTNQEIWQHFLHYEEFHNSLQPEILLTEATVFSDKHQYAGTLDMAIKVKSGMYNTGMAKPVKVEGGIYILDVKTGSVNENKFKRQIGSYRNAATEKPTLSGDPLPILEKVDGGMVLYTGANTKSGWKLEVYNATEMEESFQEFLSVKGVWELENPKPQQVYKFKNQVSINKF